AVRTDFAFELRQPRDIHPIYGARNFAEQRIVAEPIKATPQLGAGYPTLGLASVRPITPPGPVIPVIIARIPSFSRFRLGRALGAIRSRCCFRAPWPPFTRAGAHHWASSTAPIGRPPRLPTTSAAMG